VKFPGVLEEEFYYICRCNLVVLHRRGGGLH
jgi:hypothetical protein